MKKTTFPGFTAETSLYKSNVTYVMGLSQNIVTSPVVEPQRSDLRLENIVAYKDFDLMYRWDKYPYLFPKSYGDSLCKCECEKTYLVCFWDCVSNKQNEGSSRFDAMNECIDEGYCWYRQTRCKDEC